MRLGKFLRFRPSVGFVFLLACGLCVFSTPGYSQTEIPSESPVHWNVPWPQPGKPVYGYPLLPRVKTFLLYHATALTGEYSHHAQIGHFQGTFFASWSNQQWYEDGPGQRVVCSFSKNGIEWQPPFVCLPSMSGMRKRRLYYGRVLTPEAWVTVNGKMYVVGEVNDRPGHDNTIADGFETTASGKKRMLIDGRVGWGRIARSVAPNGDMGPIFWLVDDPPAPIEGFPQYPDAQNPQFRAVASQINHYLANPLHAPAWDFFTHTATPLAGDHHQMCEPTAYRRPDGVIVKLSRDCGPPPSHRMYVSLSKDEGKTWTTPMQTDIPDDPSKAVSGTLPNGKIYLIGNQVPAKANPSRDPLVISLSPDGKTFNWAAAIRHSTPPRRSPGSGRGFAYPSAIVVGDSLWVIYSINKQDVAISRLPLSELGSPRIK